MKFDKFQKDGLEQCLSLTSLVVVIVLQYSLTILALNNIKVLIT